MNLTGARLANRFLRLRFGKKNLSEAARANLYALDDYTSGQPARDLRFVVVDLETTGLDPYKDRVVSVGAFRVAGGGVKLGDYFSELVNPGRTIPAESIKVHGVTPSMIEAARPAWEVFEDFLAWLGKDVLVAHHALFDRHFMNAVMRAQHGFALQNLVVDTVLMCRTALIEPDPYGGRRGAKRCSLDALAERYNINVPERHTALGDALATALILLRLLDELNKQGWSSLKDLLQVAGVF